MNELVPILLETASTSYNIGLDPAGFVTGFFQVIVQNIAPILGLAGIMMGVNWATSWFKNARGGATK